MRVQGMFRKCDPRLDTAELKLQHTRTLHFDSFRSNNYRAFELIF